MADAAGGRLVAPAATPSEADMHHDIARDIGRHVELMILEAKRQNEAKVGKEIQKLKAKLEQMSDKIRLVTERVQRLEPGVMGGVLKTELQSSIVKLEEVWESEVGMLKRELWQTIQAHNHNADLLKHHKDAIDQVTARMQETAPQPETEQVHAQLHQANELMQREQHKEAQMDELMQRYAAVHQTFIGLTTMGPWAGGPPGMGQAATPAQAAAAAAAAAGLQAGGQGAAGGANAAGKKGRSKAQGEKAGKAAAKRQPAKAPPGAGPAGNAAAASMRPEAPVFVPTAAAS